MTLNKLRKFFTVSRRTWRIVNWSTNATLIFSVFLFFNPSPVEQAMRETTFFPTKMHMPMNQMSTQCPPLIDGDTAVITGNIPKKYDRTYEVGAEIFAYPDYGEGYSVRVNGTCSLEENGRSFTCTLPMSPPHEIYRMDVYAIAQYTPELHNYENLVYSYYGQCQFLLGQSLLVTPSRLGGDLLGLFITLRFFYGVLYVLHILFIGKPV